MMFWVDGTFPEHGVGIAVSWTFCSVTVPAVKIPA
jgi:hypothetical protein